MNVAQAHDVIYFCVRTHEELWDVNGGDDASREFADRTGISAAIDPEDDQGIIDLATHAVQYLMEP